MEYLDVIITSTCRKTLKKTLNSFFNNVVTTRKLRIIVNVDVLKKCRFSNIEKYLKNYGIDDVRYNYYSANEINGHVNAINYLYERIQSPIFFHLEDDWIFLKKIYLDPLISLMQENDNIHHIRFNKEVTKSYCWLYHISKIDIEKFRIPQEEINYNETKLVNTHVWSFNPSIAKSDFCKKIIPIPYGLNPEKYVCNWLDENKKSDLCYIYGSIGDRPIVRDIGRNRIKKNLKSIKMYFFRNKPN